MKAVVAAFNQEKALVGAFSVITNIRMQLFEALIYTLLLTDGDVGVDLALLLLAGGLGEVGLLVVAALHRVEPVHAVVVLVAGVAGPGQWAHAYARSYKVMLYNIKILSNKL